MTTTGLTTRREVLLRAEQLAIKIRQEHGATRLSLRPEFSRLLSHLRMEGIPVSRRLRQLDEELCEQDLESRFDNMPVRAQDSHSQVKRITGQKDHGGA